MRGILFVLAVAAAFAVAGCGAGGSDDKQVRATLAAYTQASAQKDYATICRRYLAPHLLDQMRQIKIRCTAALAKGLGRAQSPTLAVKAVKITGTTALAKVHAEAANQPPLDGTIELIKVGGLWRVLSLAEQPTPAGAGR